MAKTMRHARNFSIEVHPAAIRSFGVGVGLKGEFWARYC